MAGVPATRRPHDLGAARGGANQQRRIAQVPLPAVGAPCRHSDRRNGVTRLAGGRFHTSVPQCPRNVGSPAENAAEHRGPTRPRVFPRSRAGRRSGTDRHWSAHADSAAQDRRADTCGDRAPGGAHHNRFSFADATHHCRGVSGTRMEPDLPVQRSRGRRNHGGVRRAQHARRTGRSGPRGPSTLPRPGIAGARTRGSSQSGQRAGRGEVPVRGNGQPRIPRSAPRHTRVFRTSGNPVVRAAAKRGR